MQAAVWAQRHVKPVPPATVVSLGVAVLDAMLRSWPADDLFHTSNLAVFANIRIEWVTIPMGGLAPHARRYIRVFDDDAIGDELVVVEFKP